MNKQLLLFSIYCLSSFLWISMEYPDIHGLVDMESPPQSTPWIEGVTPSTPSIDTTARQFLGWTSSAINRAVTEDSVVNSQSGQFSAYTVTD
ncbi:hypothetical protein BJ546DRAFT_116093 [Cryomyces antarcticus]